ncbi:MAG: hypothetical protein QOJ93_3429 [Actinomycetota bacterium]|jgi:predicted enzyme related to lactoylglutathione lyase|nr:hypothetical protein [Actinomycetota bacterium]
MTPTDDTTQATETGVEDRLTRPGAISYLHIPATDTRQAATFYEAVFGWTVHGHDSARPGFDDGGGTISGAWMTTQEISREPGLLPYIYVEHIDDTVERIEANGGQIVLPPYPEGNLWVSTFRDPSGNVLGVWHAGPR